MRFIVRSKAQGWAALLVTGCLIALLALPVAATAHPPPRPLSDPPWSANVRVDDDITGLVQLSPSIAVDPNGNAYAVWEDRRSGTGYDVYFSYRPAGGSWSANVRVDDDGPGGDQGQASIAVDPSGNAYAVWTDFRSGVDRDIYFSYRPAGGPWGGNVKVNDDVGTANQFWPSIAVDPSGNAFAVWYDFRSGTSSDIYFSYRPAGGSWGPNVRVDDDTTGSNQFHPSIAVDPSGNAYVVWHDWRAGTNQDIYFSYRPAGGSWGPNVRVDDDTTGSDQRSPSIAVDPSGNAFAVWFDLRSGTSSDIYFSYRPAGGSWRPSVRVDDDITGRDQVSPSIAVDPCGNTFAVWDDFRSGTYWDAYSCYRPAGGSWGPNVRINDDEAVDEDHGSASIAVDPGGNAYAVWNDFRSRTSDDIYFSYLAAPIPCVLEEEFVPEFNTLALLGSGLAGLAGYTRLRWRRK
jgi:hypothetical protein